MVVDGLSLLAKYLLQYISPNSHSLSGSVAFLVQQNRNHERIDVSLLLNCK